jgi:hypothetical protein
MALIDLWHKDESQIVNKNIQQIISFAGDGKLADGNSTSQEFRELLKEVPSELIQKFAQQCLEQSFPSSGFVLQDIINEIGFRLGFDIERGLYQGRQGSIGFDGLWRSEESNSIMIEVKTTDTYRISIDTIAGYRNKLIQNEVITEDKSSILVVVGRYDTGDFEAQIRGSRYAWNIRLVSVDSLVSLMLLKENVEDPKIIRKMHDVLVPREFTKLDEIIDLIFTTAEDVKSDEIDFADADVKIKSASGQISSLPVSYQKQCVSRVSKHLNISFIPKTKVLYSSLDKEISLVCMASREYIHGERKTYWFGFHPYQLEFLKSTKQGFVALGCGTEAKVFVIKIETFEKWIIDMNKTVRPNRLYWHVHIYQESGKYTLRLKNRKIIDLNQFLI